MTDVFFPCQRCGARKFLVKGLCDTCVPDVHGMHNARLAAISRVSAAYRSATGRNELDDFEAFAEWANVHGGDDWHVVLLEGART